VDRLLGTSNIVMRALPELLEADPVISGASLDAEGNPQLVLDPVGLVDAAHRGRRVRRDEPVPPRAPVLVIDDSLTTRMLEQSILQSAGYEVELAVSAEDGLARARERPYSLFVVDVEMPGMDGFGFVAETRADASLREIPAILVTSRNAPEDRRRGEQVGARAYIVKGEFDQGQLLKTIRRLIG
jgi:two-component system chemotaxis sensor kinase CheA